jgi:hypothetical protein
MQPQSNRERKGGHDVDHVGFEVGDYSWEKPFISLFFAFRP